MSPTTLARRSTWIACLSALVLDVSVPHATTVERMTFSEVVRGAAVIAVGTVSTPSTRCGTPIRKGRSRRCEIVQGVHIASGQTTALGSTQALTVRCNSNGTFRITLTSGSEAFITRR